MSGNVVEIDGVPAAVGDHVCVFYRGAEERRRTVQAFLADGAAAGDDCLVIASPEDRRWLRTTGLEADPRIVIEGFERTYLAGKGFDPAHMLEFWTAWLGRRSDRPSSRGRTVSDMNWAGDFSSGGLRDFMAYEAESTRLAEEAGAVSLCLYDLDHVGGDVIVAALRAHPKMLFDGVLLQNPYCSPAAA
jgi:hypothetical protein